MQDLYQRQIQLEDEPCIDHGYTGDRVGYQRTHYHREGKRISTYRHRLVYCDANNVAIENIRGDVIRHKCDNPRCINPAHLEIGTQLENIQDRDTRGRTALGIQHGLAKLTADNVRFIRENYRGGRGSQYNTVTLGRMFGVSPRNITDILRHTTWKHI